jgi:hypothetical protein
LLYSVSKCASNWLLVIFTFLVPGSGISFWVIIEVETWLSTAYSTDNGNVMVYDFELPVVRKSLTLCSTLTRQYKLQ